MKEDARTRKRWLSPCRQVLLTVLVALVSWAVQRMRRGSSLFLPPFCAWRFVGNGDSFNVAFPDHQSVYHIMQMKFDEGDMVKVVAESFPYGRYMSYQTYDLKYFMSRQSLRDVDIVPENGPNAYNNLTAASLGVKQGGYTIYVTTHGDQNLTNELRALPDGVTSGHLDLFFRIYVEENKQGPPQAPWADKEPYGPEFAYEWGWAPPPKVYIKRAALGNEWRELPFCRYRRRSAFSFVPYLSDRLSPPKELYKPRGTPAGPNRDNNVYLPSYSERSGLFASRDSNYVASTLNLTLLSDKHPYLFARISGRLPITANGLYKAPYIANASDYEVRYASISSVQATLPFRTIETASDLRLERHYEQTQGHAWDRNYIVWVVSSDLDPKNYPRRIREEGAYIMKWGQSIYSKRTIKFPGLLFRQVMAQTQVLTNAPLIPSGVVNIVPEICPTDPEAVEARRRAEEEHRAGGERAEALLSNPVAMEAICCSQEAPEPCFWPPYVKHRMGEYYPSTQYFYGAGGADGKLNQLQAS